MCRLQKPIALSLNENERYYYQREWETKHLEHLSETLLHVETGEARAH